MRPDWTTLVYAALVVALVVLLLNGCSAMPTMQYCDTVWYSREGRKVHIEADCLAPMGTTLPGL